MQHKLDYNIKSSRNLGWTPEWFGCDSFGEELLEAVIQFQNDLGLEADGLVGPSTYRRIEADLLAREEYKPPRRNKRKGEKSIIYNGERYPINWDRVILWDERGGFKCKPGTYYDWSDKPERKPIQFVNHWDATLSSELCAKIISKRGLSMHFLVDNDGTIYQLMDIQDPAFQAGSKFWNNNSIGVEISNAFYMKYQDWYKKKGFGPRPIMEGYELNGRKIEKHLGFYPVQLQALAALWASVADATGINLEICETRGYCEGCAKGEHNGFINHYNLTTNKMDCASLDMEYVLELAKQNSQSC
jgi:hypothetical protein